MNVIRFAPPQVRCGGAMGVGGPVTGYNIVDGPVTGYNIVDGHRLFFVALGYFGEVGVYDIDEVVDLLKLGLPEVGAAGGKL